KTKFGMSMPKRKEPGTENTKPGSDVPHSVLETTADTSSEDGRHLDVKPQLPDEESEVSTWKIQMPSFKMAKTPKADMKTPREESTVESLDTVKKAQTEEDGMPMTDKSLKMEMDMKAGEKEIEGKESKFRLPKFKLPTFTWATTKDETGQNESQVSDREGKGPSLERGAKTYMSESEEQMKITNAEIEIGISKGKINEKDGRKLTEVQLPSLKHLTAKKSSMENHLEETEVEILITKPDIEIQNGELSISSKKTEEMAKTMMAAGEGPALGLKADIPGTKTEGAGWKVEKPSLKMPKADIKAPKVDISLPSVDVTLPKASVDLQAPEAALTLEGEAKAPEKEAAKTKDGKFKMPKFGMPSFGWSSSREAKGTVAADVDVSLKEPQVTVPSGTAEVDVTLPAAEIQAPGVEVTVETAAGGDGEKGRFKMPDVKMPSVKLPKVKAPHVQVSLPKAEVSLPKAQAEVQEGEVALQGPDAEGGLEAAAGKVEGGGMKIHMPKVKVPSVVFSKPTVKAPKLDADVSLHKVDASLPEADLKAGAGTISVAAPDIKLPSVEGSLELQAPEVDLRVPSGEGSIDGAELEAAGLKGKFKMPKFDKPKFGVSPPKAEGLEGEVSLPTAEVDLPAATVTAAGEGPALGLKADIPGTKTEGAGWKVEKPSLKMPKADIKAPKVDISLPSVDVTLPKASVDLQAPEAALTLEGEAKAPEKEAAKTKDGKFKMPKFGMPSFGWSSSREAKGTVAADVDVSLKEPQVTVPSGTAEVDKSEKGSSGEGAGMGIKMPKVTVPTLEFSKPEVKAPKIDMDVSMPTGEVILPTCEEDDLTLKSAAANASLSTSVVKVVTEDSLEVKSPDTSVEKTSNEIAVGDIEIKIEGPEGKTKMSEFQMPKEGDGSIQTPDIERSHSERTEEGAQISIKLADVDIPTLEFSKIETGASQTEMGVSSAKIDAVLPPSEGSFQQVVLKSSSTNEDTIQKTGIKFPRGEVSTELRSPEIVTERSSVVDGRKMKLEGPEGKTKMPKFQKPKFGISLTKGKVPEAEINSPKIEAELPQLKMTNEIADIAVGVPASELTSDMSDPGVEVWIPKLGDSVKSSDVSLSKIEGDTSLSTERTDSRVNIPKTETYADIVKHGAEGQKMHTSEFTVSSAELSKSYLSTSEIDKDNSLTNRFPTITVETVDKSQAGPELNIKIPKLKIPRFTFKALPTEIDVSVSKVVTDPKGSSTDIEV
ncbi:Protein AHNAK2, partial [Eudyptula minor novaehollandiae]